MKPPRAIRLGIKPPKPTEKAVEAWVIDCFKKAGCVVVKISQPRATMQTEGIPDLYVFSVRKGKAFWFEVKRPGAHLRPHQAAFRENCLLTNTAHHWGGIDEARRVLVELGLSWNPNNQRGATG